MHVHLTHRPLPQTAEDGLVDLLGLLGSAFDPSGPTIPATGLFGVVAVLGSVGLWLIRTRQRSRRDPQRLFSRAQKDLLRRQAHGRCEHKPLLWRRCPATGQQADHVIPWSRGGPTELWNGQLLCARHNRAKTNHYPSPVYRWRLRRRRRKYPKP